MRFSEVVQQARELLKRQERVTYRALKREFDLDDDALDDLKSELIEALRVAMDEDGKVLVWRESQADSAAPAARSPHEPQASTAPGDERRQLTVMFCDLVGSTALSNQLDPEDLRVLIRQFQAICAQAVAQYEGHLAQYLGDGVLVYFGYPIAHEDDAERAVRAGLAIIQALTTVNDDPRAGVFERHHRWQVRIGLHTGLAVIAAVGDVARSAQLATGETPNVAARLQAFAEPNTIVLSAVTQRLIARRFDTEPLGSHHIKGVTDALLLYRVQGEHAAVNSAFAQYRLPLTGREQEVALLRDRWAQAMDGHGHAVMLCGEPGIGKSRLVHGLREEVIETGAILFEARCSTFHQHSAFYPLIDLLQRTFLFEPHDGAPEKRLKLTQALDDHGINEAVPYFAALLSLADTEPLPLASAQKIKELTLDAILQFFIAQAERGALVLVWEDLHWADASSLEFLGLLIEQIPVSHLLLIATYRPDFVPPWKPRSHLSQVILNRLGKREAEALIGQLASTLTPEVIEQIRLKADGVPLFVEELTKSALESDGTVLVIPATLQEALLARLDRLGPARTLAQLGATLGREFTFELIAAVAEGDDVMTSLNALVDAEILYRRGIGAQARYFFKHALIQDIAYQSQLKSARQVLHRRIAETLAKRFHELIETQPEVLAHHYESAALDNEAIHYWHAAGERAIRRSANAEAIAHLTKAMTLLESSPPSIERTERMIAVLIAFGAPLIATRGYAAPEVAAVYERALTLSKEIGDNRHLFTVLRGLWVYYVVSGELTRARGLGEQLLGIAQVTGEDWMQLEAHHALAQTTMHLGELRAAQEHAARGLALYRFAEHRGHVLQFGTDPGVACNFWGAMTAWFLGNTEQALEMSAAALAMARQIEHPLAMVYGHQIRASIHQLCGDVASAQAHAAETIQLSNAHGLPFWKAYASFIDGWAREQLGDVDTGMALMRESIAAWEATCAMVWKPFFGIPLIEACLRHGRLEEAESLLAEALAAMTSLGERMQEAELYRLRGELALRNGTTLGIQQAEQDFLLACETAERQQAKTLLLRAVTSLARLAHAQGRPERARDRLRAAIASLPVTSSTADIVAARELLAG